MKKYTKEELSLIWLDSFDGLEYKHKEIIFNFLKEEDRITDGLNLAKDYISANVGENEFNTMLSSANQTYLNYVLDELDRKGIVAITFLSKEYPEQLSQIEIKPLILYAKGDVELLKGDIFGIVGSRKSLPLSISLAEEYAKELSKSFTIVTGIAEGVDCAVIKSALQEKAKVISVIAGGFDNIYPSANKHLLDKVAENGLALSEYPPKVAPKPYYFPVRNRIIAGLSKGVLIVSGSKKSGTLYTAGYAGEYGRDLFVIPYSVGVKSGEGCNDLIKNGGILTDNPQDVLEFYGIKNTQTQVKVTEEEKELLKVLSDNGQMHIEKLASALNKRTFEIMSTLSILEIKGLVVKSGNVYGLARSYSEE